MGRCVSGVVMVVMGEQLGGWRKGEIEGSVCVQVCGRLVGEGIGWWSKGGKRRRGVRLCDGIVWGVVVV